MLETSRAETCGTKRGSEKNKGADSSLSVLSISDIKPKTGIEKNYKKKTTLEEVARILGKRGGDATKRLLGREHFVVMNRKSNETKRKKKLLTVED